MSQNYCYNQTFQLNTLTPSSRKTSIIFKGLILTQKLLLLKLPLKSSTDFKLLTTVCSESLKSDFLRHLLMWQRFLKSDPILHLIRTSFYRRIRLLCLIQLLLYWAIRNLMRLIHGFRLEKSCLFVWQLFTCFSLSTLTFPNLLSVQSKKCCKSL